MNIELSQNELKQKTYYNSIASEYNKHYSGNYSLKYRHALFEHIFKEIDLKGKLVLDAMCGGGENTSYLLSKGSKVTGIDISENQCKFFKQRYPQAEAICASIFQTSFPDNHFDIIITESLHHLHPEVDKGVKEITRILKPGGYFIFWEPNSGSFLDLARKVWYKLDSKYFEDNEKSIDFKQVINNHRKSLELKKCIYGGNLAFLLVFSSMHFRIPLFLVRLYAPLFLKLEFLIQKLQSKFISCWGLAVLRKVKN